LPFFTAKDEGLNPAQNNKDAAVNITHEITKLERSSVKLSVTVSKEDVRSSYDVIVSQYAKKAQIPGFRKGHVPVPILERKFGAELKNEAVAETLEGALKELLEKIDPKPYSQPVLQTMPLPDMDNDLSFSVTYDVFPEVHITDFSGVVIKEPCATVSEKDIQNELERIQERNALILDKKADEPAASGDLVTVSWHEIDKDGGKIDGSERSGVVLTIGKGGSYYEFEDDIAGMKTGESKEISKKYKEDHADKDLAGSEKKFFLTVDAVKIKELPKIDDDLAQDVSGDFKTLDDLKTNVAKRLEDQKDRRVEELKVNALLDALVERNPMQIPASMLKAELESRLQNLAYQFGMDRSQVSRLLQKEQEGGELYEQWTPESEKRLKSSIIISSLIKDKNIAVTDEDIEEEFKNIAEHSGAQIDDVKSRYNDDASREYVVGSVKEKKLFKELFSLVKIQKGDTVSLEELLKNG
jgi:trigger factor